MLKITNLKIGSATRVGIGLVALIVGWLLLLELLVGIWPKQDVLLQDLRQAITEKIASNVSATLQNRDYKQLKQSLDEAAKDKQILSVAIRLNSGGIFAESGNHLQYWKPTSKESTLDFVSLNLNIGGKPWGALELAFKPTKSQWFKGALSKNTLSIIGAALGALILVTLYLRRIFDHLDPSSVIPDRVRSAFDSFSEGVIMIDQAGRILLANKTLSSWLEQDVKLFGKNIKQLDWIKSYISADEKNHPWMQAMESGEAVNGWRLDIKRSTGETVKSVVNSSPVLDANNNVRGCLITFDNVSKLDQLNEELQSTNNELQRSRAELDKQNEELRKLATRDPMTSCLNRRAFFEMAEPQFARAKKIGTPLCCIMTDIDHFKRFNDVYGHTVGDKVIVSVARNLSGGLRTEDLFCRYGGEEFCILLPDANIETATKLAERLRIEIETKAGQSIRNTSGLEVKSSFGVAALTYQTASLSALIDQADQALYKAKNNGRNRVETI